MRKILCLLFLFPTLLSAQKNLPLNREWGLKYEGKDSSVAKNIINKSNEERLSSFMPQIIKPFHKEKEKFYFTWNGVLKLIYRKIKKESLCIVNDTANKFYLTLDPLLNFEAGKDLADTSGEKLYKNTRGFLLRGSIGDKFAFESSFYENQSTFAQYIDNYIAGTNKLFPQKANYNYDVVPGQGRSKAFKKNGYDYAMASGYISYSPIKILNIQAGHGKHFVGDGYRSLLLSDNAFNYPYARITTTYKNVQYTNLYTSFMNLTDGGVQTPAHTERLFQKKAGSFQMLSLNFLHRIQLEFFQGMIWEAADSNNRQHVEFNTFNPVIGVNALSYGMHHKNNVLLGATLKIKIINSISLYGQYMLDDIGSDINEKYGYQIGFKYFDLFTIKNLHFQAEYNTVRPYAYAAQNPQQSYTHYNQALAHPLGANFSEAIGFINYKIKDFFVEVKINYAVKGADSSAFNFGGNVFKSDNTFPGTQVLSAIQTQGMKTTTMYQDIHFGYLVNPSANLNIVIGLTNRIEKTNKATNTTQFVYLGIRTSLANFYYDF
ncbi:MAG: hypothetical protein H0W84_08550 [Bacteroidetes bacterium]|nr:hypothetical protein [Bacteroidota bacterium]